MTSGGPGEASGAALEAAAATSGRAVLISGFTVMIAMAGMLLSGDKTFMSFAIGTMMVVAVAMIGSLTVLPAMLSKLGDRVEKGRIPFLHRLRRDNGDGSRFWGAILKPVLRHPVISAVASAAVLVVLALPALHLHTADSGLDALPKSQPELQAFHAIDDAFPGGATGGRRRDQGRATEPAIRAAIADLKAKALASGEMQNPIQVETSPDGSAFQVDIPLAGDGTDEVSNHALATLRNELVPATVGTVAGVEYAVGGRTAQSHDFNAMMKSSAPLVFGFVLLFAFLLLLVAFRSIVVALKAILLNLLSVAAAYGMLVADLPVGLGREPARLQQHRRHRVLAADVPVRDPVRALDGLPRVHPEPDPRGVRPRPLHARTPSSTASARRPASSPAPRSSWSACSASSRSCRCST